MNPLTSKRFKAPSDHAAVFDQMYRQGFTDGLPVIPPTEDAVLAMLAHVGMDPDTLIAVVAPDDARVTAEKAAVNTVMAGCLPEYFPVVIAALKAVSEPKFNLLGVQATTNPVAPVLVVNGPVRSLIDVNCRRGCMGPGWRANATIGRALRLTLVNCGGCPPGDIDKSIHGMPGKFTFCFGELEEDSPWPPLHVDQGFSAGQSTVTAFGGQGTQNILAFFRSPEGIIHVVADAMRCYGYNGYLRAKGNPLLVMTPGHAKIFADHGWDKQRIRHELFTSAQIPRSHIPTEQQLLTPVYASHASDQMCLPCEKEEDIMIVVAGGPEAYHITYIPSFGNTEASTAEVSIPQRRVQ